MAKKLTSGKQVVKKEKKKGLLRRLFPGRFALETSADLVVAAYVYKEAAPYLAYAGQYYDKIWAKYEKLFERITELEKLSYKIDKKINEFKTSLRKIPYLDKYIEEEPTFEREVKREGGTQLTTELVPSLPSWLKPRTDSLEHFMPDVLLCVLGTIVLYRAGKRSARLTWRSLRRQFRNSKVLRYIKKKLPFLKSEYDEVIEEFEASVEATIKENVTPLEAKIKDLEAKIVEREVLLEKLLSALNNPKEINPSEVEALAAEVSDNNEKLTEGLKSAHKEIGDSAKRTVALIEAGAKRLTEITPSIEMDEREPDEEVTQPNLRAS